ncbi:ankyrin repeat domain 35 [Turdus rufiventris]|nr:ankyrin repeat domain 35 [Turdus rufiventris]
MYEVHAASRDDRNHWMKVIQQAVSLCPSRQDFPLIETETEASLRKLKERMEQHDRQIAALLEDKVGIFADMLALGSGCSEPTLAPRGTPFPGDPSRGPRGDVLLHDAIREAENGAGQVGIRGKEEEEEEAEEQRDGGAARRLREELVRKTLESRRLEEAAEGILRRLRELVRLLPGRDAPEDEEDEGACLELLARRVVELRKRTRDEEREGGHGSAEAPALIPFLAWLAEQCSKMREAKAGAFSRSQELRREAQDPLRAQAWERLAAGLEQALEQQDQIHGRMLQGAQTLLEKLRGQPAPGGKSREETPRESGTMEKELLELREGNGKLLVELARLGRERERLQRELRELRDPGARDEAWRLRRELRELRDGLGARVREAGGDAGAGILRDLHRRLDALVRSQHEALQLITEMEGEAGESPGSGGEGGGPAERGRPELGVPAEPPGLDVQRWKEAAEEAEARAAGRERELRELRDTAEGLERSRAALRERAARLERACRDKDGKLKQLLAETEKLSAEVLGLRGRSARLQLQLEVSSLAQQGDEVSGQARCPFDAKQSIVALFVDGSLYSATVADFQASDAVIYRSLSPGQAPLRTLKYSSRWLQEPHFVQVLPYGPYVYFFFREVAVELSALGKVLTSQNKLLDYLAG